MFRPFWAPGINGRFYRASKPLAKHFSSLRGYLLIAVLAVVGCSHKKPQGAEIDVFAAASLKNVFGELNQRFESQKPGVTVKFSFAGSQQLALQINQGAPCDVFASADQAQMKNAKQSNRIPAKSVLKFAENRLVIAVPEKSEIQSVKDLTKRGLKVVLAGPSVPAGAYAVKMLTKGGEPFKSAVLKNVVSYEQDVRAVLTKVALGEADAGVVYATDIQAAKGVRAIELPAQFETKSAYYIAALNGPHQDAGSKFVSFVMSPEGQKLLSDDGFVVRSK